MRNNPLFSHARNSSVRRSVGSLALVGAVALTGLAACSSDDDDESAQDRYCEAGESLRSSLEALTNVDLVAEGTSGLETAVEAVSDDVDTLQDTATDAAEGDVEALNEALDGLESSLSDLGDDVSEESTSQVTAAIEGVTAAASAVYDTLTDCP